MGARGERGDGKAAYHHGDLRNALVEAATDLAREGGPDAVVLRAAARRVGVSPTAAYRHFRGQEDLLFAVKVHGQELLATSMDAAIARADAQGLERRVMAMGHGYVSFALREPGLFRAAFCGAADFRAELDETGAPCGPGAEWQFRSIEMLIDILDDLEAAGRMSPERRPGAEITAWSMVHGLAVLFLDSPFALLTVEQRDAAIDQALETLLGGFTRS